MTMMPFLATIKILLLTTLAFVTALVWAPVLVRLLRKHRMGKQIRDAASAPVMAKLHEAKAGTPTMGGILIWATTIGLMLLFHYGTALTGWHFFEDFTFFSRSQTLLPAGVLLASALVGMLDDYYNARRIGPKGGGLRMRHRLLIYTAIATVGALWFFYKLDWDLLRIPFIGAYNIGVWYVPFFILVIVATSFSVNETDGLDGLAGGVLLACFSAYVAIAFIQGKMELAAFCGVIAGSLAAFLWHNVNPAAFFMGDTGAMSLGVTLGVVAMLTNTALLLPLIGFVFVLESLSVMMQVASKQILKRKILLSAPLHHHLEAIGWPEPKIVMRFWIIAGVTAAGGLIAAMVDHAFF